MTTVAARALLWSGHQWVDRVRPGRALLRGRAYLTAKRVFDLTAVVCTAPIWAPLLALLALVVKAHDRTAPVFDHSEQSGRAGRFVTVHRFRTLVPNASALEWELRHLNELEWPEFRITPDPRITRPGSILLKCRLAGLPQLWDVLAGRLSLVGPRPSESGFDAFEPWEAQHLTVRPGITGLWRTAGWGLPDPGERIRLDIAYMQRRCLWLDAQILLRTIFRVPERRSFG
jgi:lipopolysaccharide/colanic/teichoic acid biosynthesis glycosyltransferase